MSALLLTFSMTHGGSEIETGPSVINNMKRPRSLSFIPSMQLPRISSFTCHPSSTHLPQRLSFQPRGRLPAKTVHQTGSRRMLHMSNRGGSESKDGDNTENAEYLESDVEHADTNDMTVYRRNGRRRPIGELPFDVSIITPPPRYLGRFQLDPLTHCGDILEHDGNHFEVKVVRVRYRFREGRYRVVGKAVEVKSLARKAVEVYLERKFQKS